MAVSSLLLLVALAAKAPGWAVVWFTLSLGILGLCEAAFWTVAVQMGGNRGGLSASVMNTGGNGIGLLAPMLTPWVGQRLGWHWGIGLGAAVGLLGALCWLRIRPAPNASAGRRKPIDSE
jgi:dipeptide/tripeptide permease